MTSKATDTARSVLVTTRSFGSGAADPEGFLKGAGLEVMRADPGHDPAALAAPLSGAAAWIAGTAPVDDGHLAAAPNLRIVARYGAGYDAVDLGAAARRGVLVTNTPGVNVESVADHTVGLILVALRHIVDGD